jgi:hypothetical protein
LLVVRVPDSNCVIIKFALSRDEYLRLMVWLLKIYSTHIDWLSRSSCWTSHNVEIELEVSDIDEGEIVSYISSNYHFMRHRDDVVVTGGGG